jgi:HK97 gp10 family phage protein
MTFSVDLSGLKALSAQLEAFGDFVKGDVAMEGAAAFAKVVYDEARIRAPISEAAHIFYGRNSTKNGVVYRFEPGSLRAAIYRKYSEEKSTGTLKAYRISWNQKKAPYGHMVELGTLHAPAHSFLGAAFYARQQDGSVAALAAMAAKLAEFGGMA